MDALLMCGGRGTRLDADAEKPLFEVCGTPLVDRVLSALEASSVETTYAVASPHAPETAAHVDAPTIETPGDGYVADLEAALADDRVRSPVLTVAADLPLLASPVVDDVLASHEAGSTTVAVPAALKRLLGASVDATFERDGRELAPTGVNVVADEGEAVHVSHDVRLALNVNRRRDADVAERLCHS